MKHITLSHFGQRPVTAGLLAARTLAATAADCPPADKWAVLNHLRIARASFGITDRDLTVLAALVSFLPVRSMEGQGALVVFPSNRALSDRAHGMPESTLRRHLAALVRCGLICRQDSPNGKRYAQRGPGGGIAAAFGFDLRPLLAQAAAIASAASDATQAASDLRHLRTALVLRLRDADKLVAYAQQIALTGDWASAAATVAAVRGSLRRKLDAAGIGRLAALLEPVEQQLLPLTAPSVTTDAAEMSGSAIPNERHCQNSDKELYESESGHEKVSPDDTERHQSGHVPPTCTSRLTLGLIVKACPDILPYANDRLTTWQDLASAADRVWPLMGISPSAWFRAQATMGPTTASIVIAGMLQRFTSIRNAGGYLRKLTNQTDIGAFSPVPMIMALVNATGVLTEV